MQQTMVGTWATGKCMNAEATAIYVQTSKSQQSLQSAAGKRLVLKNNFGETWQ